MKTKNSNKDIKLKAIILLACLALVLSSCTNPVPQDNAQDTQQPQEQVSQTEGTALMQSYDLKIGWQTTWATQGQMALILQKTDLLKNEGINAEFVGFSYGGPLNEAALAGSVDVVFTADQPAITLLSKSGEWEIIGRLMYNSGALMVHPNSELSSIADLKGKTIAVPFVAAVHRILIGLEKEAGLVPDVDVKNVNLGIDEIINTAQAGFERGWGDIGAMMVWDPTPFLLEEKNLTRTISRGDIVAVILMNKEKTQNPEIPVNFLKAFKRAYYFYSQNTGLANQWFADAARIDYDPSILNKAAAFEPNTKVTALDEVRVSLNEKDISTLKEVSSFLLDQKLVSSLVDIDSVVNPSYLEEAEKSVGTDFDLTSVKITE